MAIIVGANISVYVLKNKISEGDGKMCVLYYRMGELPVRNSVRRDEGGARWAVDLRG